MVHDSSDTICAIATAPGVGGIAVVRISGLKALPVILRLFHHKGKQLSVEGVKPRHAYYGEVIADGELVDEVVMTYFQAPQKFLFKRAVGWLPLVSLPVAPTSMGVWI